MEVWIIIAIALAVMVIEGAKANAADAARRAQFELDRLQAEFESDLPPQRSFWREYLDSLK